MGIEELSKLLGTSYRRSDKSLRLANRPVWKQASAEDQWDIGNLTEILRLEDVDFSSFQLAESRLSDGRLT